MSGIELKHTKISDIPFEHESSRNTLNKLNGDLGGLHISFYPPSEAHKRCQSYLRLDFAARNGSFYDYIGGAYGNTPDEALGRILMGVESACVERGHPLVVNINSKADMRMFRVNGNIHDGFIFARNDVGMKSQPAQTAPK
jgi:hypothetical protein